MQGDTKRSTDDDAGVTAEAARLERAEEQLVPEVTRREAGQVVLHKRTETVRETSEVLLHHDELDLERRSADRPLAPGEQPVASLGEETVVLVIEERLETRKVPWVVEEIHVHRRLVTEPATISDEVRKERIDVETTVDLVARGESSPPGP
jgi:uncharacterized protein (TIGR02271 family)